MGRAQTRASQGNRAGTNSGDISVFTGATPELRICRRVDIAAPGYTGEWNTFLNETGQQLYGDGNVKALGAMTTTLVSANEMGRMLSDRHPDAYSGRCSTKTRKQINEYFKKIRSYTVGQSRAAAQATKRDEGREVARGEDDQYSRFHNNLARNKLWQAGIFVVRNVEPYGGTKLGFSLSDPENEALRVERSQLTTEFLKGDLGLNTRLMSRDFDPHISFFIGNHPIGQMILPNLCGPVDIALEAPGPIANLKK